MSTEQLQSTSPVQRTHVFQFSGASSAVTLPSGVAVKFPENMSADERSRVEEVIARLREATVQVDAQGRISLDLGSVADAHNEETPSLSSSLPLSLSAQPETTQEDEESDEEHQAIFKHLEHFSCDEYDDFNPRHPLPKDRAHRRGDSYFNSDIEMVVGELGGQAVKPVDLSSIARAALEEPAPVPAAAAAAPEGPTGAKSVKDRILARAKNNNAGAPPTRPKSLRAVNALNEGSDEEN